MKVAAGLFLLLAGWIIVLAAVMLLSSETPRLVFVSAGIAIEILGFILSTRAHLTSHRVGW